MLALVSQDKTAEAEEKVGLPYLQGREDSLLVAPL